MRFDLNFSFFTIFIATFFHRDFGAEVSIAKCDRSDALGDDGGFFDYTMTTKCEVASATQFSSLLMIDGKVVLQFESRCDDNNNNINRGFICSPGGTWTNGGNVSLVSLNRLVNTSCIFTKRVVDRLNAFRLIRRDVDYRRSGDAGAASASSSWVSAAAMEIDSSKLAGVETPLQISVESSEEGEALLVMSPDCHSAQRRDTGAAMGDFGAATTAAYVQFLTFNKFGRMTLSKSSLPSTRNLKKFYLHLLVDEKVERKAIRVVVGSTLNYPSGEVYIVAIVSFLVGVAAVLFYLSVFRGFRMSKTYLSGVSLETLAAVTANWFVRGKKGFSYITAIFALTYLVGAYQVIIADWRLMQSTGNRDVCFYNERCYIPSTIWGDIPVNLLNSNVPYVIHGFTILLAFAIREQYCYSEGHHAFYNYSIAYALAWSFVFEGIFSTIYHVCPTRVIFQFDTAFMFVISSLIFVCLVNRFSIVDEDLRLLDQKANSNFDSVTTYYSGMNPIKSIRSAKIFLFFLTPILLFNFLGSMRDVNVLDSSSEIAYYFFLYLWYVLLLAWGACKFYLLPAKLNTAVPRPKFSDSPEAIAQLLTKRTAVEGGQKGRGKWTAIRESTFNNNEEPSRIQLGSTPESDATDSAPAPATSTPVSSTPAPCVVWKTFVFTGYTVALIIWLSYTVFERKDMSKFFLGSCIATVFLAMVLAEMRSDKPLETVEAFRNLRVLTEHLKIAVFYSIVLALWVAAAYFFVVVETTNKSKRPSENRDLNRDCVFMNFYDSHSVWHFLSSSALLLCALRSIVISSPCRMCKFMQWSEQQKLQQQRNDFKNRGAT